MRSLAVAASSTLLIAALCGDSHAAVPGADEVLERAIAYHDPDGHWESSRFELRLEETRPEGASRFTQLIIDNARSSFEILTQRDGAEIEGLMAGQDCVVTLNGSTEFSAEEKEIYRLTCERIAWLRDYYSYLWGLPMKLRDPGTRIDPLVTADTYQQRDVWRLRVTYDESVGSDIWYFYFDRESFRLAGYRFFRSEAEREGEYITLDEEVEDRRVRLPRRRTWYDVVEDRHLGDDILVDLAVIP